MRLAAMILAEFLRRARGVEVAQRDKPQPVDLVVPAQDLLKHELGFAIGIDRSLRQRLVDRHALRRSESGAGRGENKPAHICFEHAVEKVDSGADIIPKIFRWILHRFSDERVGGKVHHCFRLRFLKRAADLLPAREVAANERGPLIDRAPMALAQVVEDDDLMAFIEQELDANAPDVACSADDKDFHPRESAAGAAAVKRKSA